MCAFKDKKKKKFSFYIHIPFCTKKCYYCDFTSYYNSSDELKEKYVNALVEEIERYAQYDSGYFEVSSIYFGGGTPSVLSSKQFSKIIKAIALNFNLEYDLELTVEVNPESVDEEKLNTYKANLVNRISIGLQSSDDKLLKKIGRGHSYVQFMNAYDMLRKKGFNNISLDIISNLIGQSIKSYEDTLKKIISLNPEHVSSYSLSIEEGTVFASLIKKGKLKYDDSLDRPMYDMTSKFLKEAGYDHYEISNYCIDDKRSRHNLRYWELEEYKGFGIGAASYINGKRYKNILNIRDYIKAEGEFDNINILEYIVDDRAFLEEFLFLGLRKLEGISVKKVKKLAGKYEKEIFDKIEEQILKGYLIYDLGMIRLTKLGVDFSNTCFSELLLD